MKTLLVAERMNIGVRWPSAERLVAEGCYERWLEFSKGVGCFGAGMSARAPAAGAGRRRLATIGVAFDDGLNLLPPGSLGEWDARQAREVADELRWMMIRGELDYDRVVVLGLRAAAALGLSDLGLLRRWGGAIVAPHPSGRSRWWNDADLGAARQAMADFYARDEETVTP